MDIIELTREVGKALQQDESYLALKVATQVADEDMELQGLIGNFNLKRLSVNNETKREDRDPERLKELNIEMREAYLKVMQNEKMAAYQAAKEKFDALLMRVQRIIVACSQGADPETADYNPDEDDCTGNCATCGGCS
ncbi:MAG: YlbF family regulator [Clostridia bacterium]|nr:YlbF family regulator [Clostridia bacterium]